MQVSKKYKKILEQRWGRILIWGMLIAICIPYIRAACYAVFRADDFCFYFTNSNQAGISNIVKAWDETMIKYKEWQGGYVSTFLLYLLNPLHIYSYSLLRGFLVFMCISALIGLLFFMYVLVDYVGIDRKYALYITAVFLVPILSYREYTQIYLWYTGAMAYFLPSILLLYGLAFLLLGRKTKKMKWYVLSGIFLYLMTGCVLEVVGLGMFCLLFVILLGTISEKENNKPSVCVFAVALFGAMLNAFAPGNFARHELFDDRRINVMKVLCYSVKIAFDEFEWLVRDTTFLVFVILAFWIGIVVKRKIEKAKMFIAIVAFIFLPVVTVFPVVMGYSAEVLEALPNRCLFPLDVSLIASLIGLSIIAGSQLMAYQLIPERRTIGYVSIVAILMITCIKGNKLREYTPNVITRNFHAGVIQAYASGWKDIFDNIANSKDSDVVIEWVPEYAPGCSYTYLEADAANWVNEAVAAYFDKNSVCYIPQTTTE